MESALSELTRAVEYQHGGRATFVQSVPVKEEYQGQTVWEGIVTVLDLADSPGGAGACLCLVLTNRR